MKLYVTYTSPYARLARILVESVMAVASSERSPERLVVLKQMVADWRGPGTLVVAELIQRELSPYTNANNTKLDGPESR